MYLLFESPAGYALFQCDESKAATPDAINALFSQPSAKKHPISLKAFSKFESTADALSEASQLIEGSLPDSLKKFLKKEVKKSSSTTLGVIDTKLGKAIAKKLEISVTTDPAIVGEWTRGARSLLPTLLSDASSSALGTMALGLAHSLSRFKLKFSSDRLDSMVVQAIALLDDLDKELNTYAMRLREWYGWHFPELATVLTDSLAYAKTIKVMGRREEATTSDLSTILPEDLEARIQALAALSMGTELTDDDLTHIKLLADQVIALSEYRAELSQYLRVRMEAIAPNLTALLGELVGARLIAHSGTLLELAKQPASTIQLLGAEKALFRALKSRSPTPKYGLLFHTSLVGQAGTRTKGKIARVLAAKAALSIRIDALARDDVSPQDSTSHTLPSDATFGIASRLFVEKRLRALERSTTLPSSTKKYTFVNPEEITTTLTYSTKTDVVASTKRKLVEEVSAEENTDRKKKKEKKNRKEKEQSSEKEKGKEKKKKSSK